MKILKRIGQVLLIIVLLALIKFGVPYAVYKYNEVPRADYEISLLDLRDNQERYYPAYVEDDRYYYFDKDTFKVVKDSSSELKLAVDLIEYSVDDEVISIVRCEDVFEKDSGKHKVHEELVGAQVFHPYGKRLSDKYIYVSKDLSKDSEDYALANALYYMHTGEFYDKPWAKKVGFVRGDEDVLEDEDN